MELILWRHADAEEGAPDLERKLTSKGRKQAERVAEWLQERLPEHYRVLSSPAARAQQTAHALQAQFDVVKVLAPGASVPAILKAAGWPAGKGLVVVVGHQPDLGRAAAYLVSGKDSPWPLKKAGLWWISNDKELLVRAVVSPGLL